MIGYLGLVLAIVVFLVVYVYLFVVTWRECSKLVSFVSDKRQTRKFFKKIEEIRRDFA